MALFQKSVLNKYLKTLDDKKVNEAYQKFTAFFHNPTIIQNIRDDKEEQFQYGFLQKLFDEVLDYTINPNIDFNLSTEFKNLRGAKKADGAILKDGKAVGVIELKSTKTKELNKITDQAFGYKNNHPTCVYVVTSNFEKLRFYINDAVDYLDFDLFTLNVEQFKLMYLCLQKDQILQDIPQKVKKDSTLQEENITKKLYKDYSAFKNALYHDLVLNNPEVEKLTLFKKSQKLIDRFLFIFFAEDKGLLPPNSISKIVKHFEAFDDLDDYRPLYNVFKQYFGYINSGRPAKNGRAAIFAFNGGLFAPDATLDSLKITDAILMNHSLVLSGYDFESEVDVNILGHIFEHSLNEIDEITAELAGETIDKSKTKRKKDGVFYTPKYITKYIVDNTVGKLCDAYKEEHKFDENEYRFNRTKNVKKRLLAELEAYRAYLLSLTICDPACGSGAFLNQALDFLIREHRHIDALQTRLLGGSIILSDITNSILERNIYGVDINEESVDIARLSLWLRTAQKGRALTTLSSNIKCGNSLIDDVEVAGEKAFKWETEFPEVFKLKDKQAFHVVLTTHNSRISERMRLQGIRKENPVELSLLEEIKLTEIIGGIVDEKGFNCISYNICKDHVHMLVVCEYQDLASIVGTIKGTSSRLFNIWAADNWSKGLKALGESPDPDSKGFQPLATYNPEEHENHLWSQKFFHADLDVWKLPTLSKKAGMLYKSTHLGNALEYIKNNRNKHDLPASDKLEKLIEGFVVGQDLAFVEEFGGGFDIVIGNPPYVRQELIGAFKPYFKENFQSFAGTADLFTYFYEKSVDIINNGGFLSFITNDFNKTNSSTGLRSFLKMKTKFISFVDFSDVDVFKGTTTYPVILTLKKGNSDYFQYCKMAQEDIFNLELAFRNKYVEVSQNTLVDDNWTFKSETERLFFKKINSFATVKEKINKCYRGLLTGLNEAFIIEADIPVGKNVKYYLEGKDLKKWNIPKIGKKLILFPSKSTKEVFGDLSMEDGLQKMQESNRSLMELLLPYEEKAKKRYDKGEYWWELRNCAYYDLFERPKIVFPNLQNSNKFSYDDTGRYINAPAVILPTNDKALLAILNSKIVWYFLTQICVVRSGGYIEVKPQYFEQIPIPDYGDKYQILFDLSDNQIRATDNLQKLAAKFLRTIQRKFPIEKVSKNLQNWHTLTFAEFVKELKKKKVKLGLAEESEWEDYFETEKAKAMEIQAMIDKTDKEIDRMVYDLYGLTEEEIAVVEAS